MLKGKHVVLAVTGGIAAYKMATMASLLVKQHADVQVLMTQNATNFINPITFETLTGHKCLVDTFDRNFEFNVEHVSVAKQADIALVAPATANVIGKLANGLADDMLTTTLLACKCKKLVAPAMNTQMYENPIVQDNLKKLEHYGMELIQPVSGHLACGDSGMGKMVEPEVMLQYILQDLALEKDMQGLKVLVTAGPTQEAIDPVRYITNHSTGTMGYQLARNCMLRGAEVTLVTGRTALTPPPFVKVVPVVSAQEMYEAVTSRAAEQDSSSRLPPWRITARPPWPAKRSRRRRAALPFRWSARRISCAVWAKQSPRGSFCAALPWRPRIWRRTPAKSWRPRIWIWW